MRIFIDTAPLIYLLEGQSTVSDQVEIQLGQWISTGKTLITSTMTLLELLVIPKKQGDNRMVRKYRALLTDLLSEPLVPLTESIAEMAAEIRGTNGFKTPDSIQLATAVHSGADIFFTNDLRLANYTEIEVLTLSTE